MSNAEPRVFPLSIVRVSAAPKSALLPELPDYRAQLIARQKADKALSKAREKLQIALDRTLRETPTGEVRARIYNARKDFFNRSKMPPPDLIAATGQRDLGKAIRGYAAAYQKQKTVAEISERLVEEGLVATVRAMQSLAQHKALRASLPYFSRDLLAALPGFVQADPTQLNKKTRHTALAVWQLGARMCARNTPLAHLAGVRLIDLEAKDEAFEHNDAPLLNKVSVSPNVALLEWLYELMVQSPEDVKRLHIQINPTAYGLPPVWLGDFESEERLVGAEQADATSYQAAMQLAALPAARFDDFCADAAATAHTEKEAIADRLWNTTLYQLTEWQWPVNGLSPDWAYKLYKYLGEASDNALAIAMAQWLQWLQQAARTLPYRSEEEVCRIQDEAIAGLRTLLEKNQDTDEPFETPPIPPEHFFYADTCAEEGAPLPDRQAIRQAAADLFARYISQPDKPKPALYKSLLAFWQRRFKSREQAIPYMEFLQSYLANRKIQPKWIPVLPQDTLGRNKTMIGALITPFTDTDSKQRYVVEALYPGGGRLFARWLHLFNPEHTELLREWIRSHGDWHALSKQAWTNANYQPKLCDKTLGMHGGRMFNDGNPQNYTRLSDLAVYQRDGELGFFDMVTGHAVHVLDLGLEAFATREASVKTTLAIGAPQVSRKQMYPAGCPSKGVFSPRVENGEFIFRRASWRFDPDLYEPWIATTPPDATRFYRLLEALDALSAPRFVEAHWEDEPETTRFYDFLNPLSALSFLSELRAGKGRIITLVEHPAFEALAHNQRLYSMAIELGAGS